MRETTVNMEHKYRVFSGKAGRYIASSDNLAAAISAADSVAQWYPADCRHWRAWVTGDNGDIYTTLVTPFTHNGRRQV